MMAITINLDQLKQLMLEFVAARGGDIDDDNLLRRLTLSDFLLYLRQKQEQSNVQTETNTDGSSPETSAYPN